jgi:hypothetical protein
LVSGVGITAYWTSNLLAEIVKYGIACAAIVLCIKIFNVESFAAVGEDYLLIWGMFIFFGLAMIT